MDPFVSAAIVDKTSSPIDASLPFLPEISRLFQMQSFRQSLRSTSTSRPDCPTFGSSIAPLWTPRLMFSDELDISVIVKHNRSLDLEKQKASLAYIFVSQTRNSRNLDIMILPFARSGFSCFEERQVLYHWNAAAAENAEPTCLGEPLLVCSYCSFEPDVLHGFDMEVLLSPCVNLKVSTWSKIGRGVARCSYRTRLASLPVKIGPSKGKEALSGRLLCDTYASAKEHLRERTSSLMNLSLAQLTEIEPVDVPQ